MAQAVASPKTETTTERSRYSFGKVWNANVIAGKVKDHEKLIAHAVKLKLAAKSEVKRWKFETLLTKVSDALQNPQPETAEITETVAENT